MALTFSGTSLLILCINSKKGGKADLYVDGRKSGIINAYVPKTPLMNSLWHIYGLKNEKQTTKIIMRHDQDELSKGKDMLILGAVVYR